MLTIKKGHCALRVRGQKDRVDMEMTVYRPHGEAIRRRFAFTGWDRVCELAYALEQAMQGNLPRVVQWYDPENRTVAMLFFRLEDYGDGELKGRIYLRLAEAERANLPEASRASRTDEESTRMRLTRLEAFKLRILCLRSVNGASAGA